MLCYGLTVLGVLPLIMAWVYSSQLAYPSLLAMGVMLGLAYGLEHYSRICAALLTFLMCGISWRVLEPGGGLLWLFSLAFIAIAGRS